MDLIKLSHSKVNAFMEKMASQGIRVEDFEEVLKGSSKNLGATLEGLTKWRKGTMTMTEAYSIFGPERFFNPLLYREFGIKMNANYLRGIDGIPWQSEVFSHETNGMETLLKDACLVFFGMPKFIHLMRDEKWRHENFPMFVGDSWKFLNADLIEERWYCLMIKNGLTCPTDGAKELLRKTNGRYIPATLEVVVSAIALNHALRVESIAAPGSYRGGYMQSKRKPYAVVQHLDRDEFDLRECTMNGHMIVPSRVPYE